MCDAKKHLSGLKKHMQFQLYHLRSIFELHIKEPKLRASCESAMAVSKLQIVSVPRLSVWLMMVRRRRVKLPRSQRLEFLGV